MSTRVPALLKSETGTEVECQFNPSEITITKTNKWTKDDAPGLNVPTLIFGSGDSGTMKLSLMLDTTDSGDAVTDRTNEILELMEIDEDLPDSDPSRGKGRPPWVEFHWGGMVSFRMVIEKIQLNFTYFSHQGVPLRARVDLSLKQFEDQKGSGLQNPTSHTPHVHRIHQVQLGETLDRIAGHYYGEPGLWRLIADSNGVTDPLKLEPGADLMIPDRGVKTRG